MNIFTAQTIATALTKAEAIQLFGSKKALAEALGVHRSLISKLPNQLPTKYSDRMTGAAIRLGRVIPDLIADRQQPDEPLSC